MCLVYIGAILGGASKTRKSVFIDTFVHNWAITLLFYSIKVWYQFADTTVPSSWYCSISYNTPSLVLQCFKLTMRMHCLSLDNTLS